jgi:hypothetical protein
MTFQPRYKLQHDMLLQAGDFNRGNVACFITMYILPISIQHTSTRSVFYPDLITDDGDESILPVLTGKTSHTSAFIASRMMPHPVRKSRADLILSPGYILYFIEITVEVYSGLLGPRDGIGVQKLELSRIIPMPDFWKHGFTMMTEVVLFSG